MFKIIITGAGGYIGSVATDLFLKSGYEVIGLDNFQTGYRQPLELLKNKYPNKFKFYEIDLKNDLTGIFEKEPDITAVIHYAASCLVDESVRYPGKYFLNNVAVTSNLLATMEKFSVKNIIFSSTCAVYGEAEYYLKIAILLRIIIIRMSDVKKMGDTQSRLEKFKKHSGDFMVIYAATLGVVMGMGFLFLGILRNKISVILFAGIALLMGLLTIPTLINEKDEYDLKDITPRNPEKPARPSAREIPPKVSHYS